VNITGDCKTVEALEAETKRAAEFWCVGCEAGLGFKGFRVYGSVLGFGSSVFDRVLVRGMGRWVNEPGSRV